jgi:branched-chain amino acid transport system permease protein
MTEALQNVINAVALGSVYALFALGIALIFGVMRLVNLAHGELLMAAGYTLLITDGWAWPVRIAAAVVVGVVVACLMHQLAFRPLRDADPVTLLVGSLAVSYLVQSLALVWQGPTAKAPENIPFWTDSVTIGDLRVSTLSLVAIFGTALLLAGLHLLLQRTTFGLRIRAAAEDFTMARLLGVRANGVVLSAFAVGGALAAVGGVLLIGQVGTVTPTVGVSAMLFGLVACIVGGLGSLAGAVLGGFLLGTAAVTLQVTLPLELRPYRDAFLFGGVFLLILLRPEGLVRTSALQERV